MSWTLIKEKNTHHLAKQVIADIDEQMTAFRRWLVQECGAEICAVHLLLPHLQRLAVLLADLLVLRLELAHLSVAPLVRADGKSLTGL